MIKTLKVERISIETKAKDSRLGVGVSKTYKVCDFPGRWEESNKAETRRGGGKWGQRS